MAAGPQGDDDTCRHLCRSRAGRGLCDADLDGRARYAQGRGHAHKPFRPFHVSAPRGTRGTPGTQDARVASVKTRSPSVDLTRTRTAFLPPDLAVSIASTTSAG